MERIQKIIAQSGYCSRRKAEELISQGKVSVNGNIVTEMGLKVSGNDDILVEGKAIDLNNVNYVYYLLNKPRGIISSSKDEFNRKTVVDLIETDKRIYPIGRLDYDTTGLILLTNDGDFVYHITHPKNEITKTYTVTLKGEVSDKEIQSLRDGVILDDGYKTSPAKVKKIMWDEDNNKTRLEIIIHEGKNREVRRMCEAVNKKVLALHRSKIGNLSLDGLKIGKWRYLTDTEVQSLKK